MINITFKPKTLQLDVTGHADYGKKGEDIVCSAISTLFYTLCQMLYASEEMLQAPPNVRQHDGEGYVWCKPKKEYEGNIAFIYRTILVGMEMVASEYPKNVTFKVEG